MVKSNKAIANLVGGELSPLMYARIDLPIYAKSVAKAENFIVIPQGGARYRNGSRYIKSTRLNKTAVFIPFQFSDQQAYLIEATDQKFRFYKDNSAITETPKTITAISVGQPSVFTVASHGYSDGDEVYLDNISGVTGLTGRFYLIANSTTNTFTLTDLFGVPFSNSGITGTAEGSPIGLLLALTYTGPNFSGTYQGGGTVARVYEVTTPYLEADLESLQYAQNADTMYIVSRSYAPRKLTRSAHTSWSLATFTRTADPFTSSTKWPGAVTFTDSGRLVYGGTTDNPESIWGSKAPTTGTPAYDDFTTGTGETDAFAFTLAPVHGKVDSIQWLTNTSKFIVAGTFGNIRRLYGSIEQESISPTAITAKSVNALGCAGTLPVSNGDSLFYIQRDRRKLRSLEYDIAVEGYTTTDRNLVSEHITRSTLKQIVEQQADPEVIWARLLDGRFAGLTYKGKEDISGWHRHFMGGNHVDSNSVTQEFAKVLNVGRMSRGTAPDQLWLIVERRIGNKTIRTVEYIEDEVNYPIRSNFYSFMQNDDPAEADVEDTTKYNNALFEAQKDAVYVDMAASYDGSSLGADNSATLKPGAIANGPVGAPLGLLLSLVSTGVVFTASSPVFTADMVGRQLWKKYDSNGNGGGRAEIIQFLNSTEVLCNVLSDFDTDSAIPAGSWFITATEISGLEHLEGEEVTIIADGGVHASRTVEDGAISLDQHVSKAHVGYQYRGLLETLNIDSGGVTGPAEAKTRNMYELAIRLKDTIGIAFGTDNYRLTRLEFREVSQYTDRPVPPFSGIVIEPYFDTYNAKEKKLLIRQDFPLPATILGVDLFMNTAEKSG